MTRYDFGGEAINDPLISSSTFARPWVESYAIDLEDRYEIGINVGAEVRQTAQQGLRARGFVNSPPGIHVSGSPWDGYGVTNNYTSNWNAPVNTGTHTFYIYKTASAQSVRVGANIYGETVNGCGGMRMAGGGALFCNTNREFSIPAYPAPTVPSSAPTYTGGQSIGSGVTSFPYYVHRVYGELSDSTDSVVATGYATSNSTVSVSATLSNNNKYRARCRTWNNIRGYSSYSAYSGWYYTAPSAPSALSASGKTSVSLSWGSGGSPDISNTTLQRSTDGGSTWATIYNGAYKTSHTDASPPSGSLLYHVRETNPGGTTSWSASASVTTMTSPAAPTSATLNTFSRRVSWINHSLPQAPYSSIELQKNINSGGWPADDEFTSLPSTASFYTETDTTLDVIRQYRIRSRNAAGASDWVTVSKLYAYGISNPSIQLSANSAAEASILVEWDSPINNLGYTGSLDYTVTHSSTSYSDSLALSGALVNNAQSISGTPLTVSATVSITISGKTFTSSEEKSLAFISEPLPPTSVRFDGTDLVVSLPADINTASTRTLTVIDNDLPSGSNTVAVASPNGDEQDVTFDLSSGYGNVLKASFSLEIGNNYSVSPAEDRTYGPYLFHPGDKIEINGTEYGVKMITTESVSDCAIFLI